MKTIICFFVFLVGISASASAKSDFPWKIFIPAIIANQQVDSVKNIEIVDIVETWSGETVRGLMISFDQSVVSLEGMYLSLHWNSCATGTGIGFYLLDGEEIQIRVPPGERRELTGSRFFLFRERWTAVIPLQYVCEDFSQFNFSIGDYYGENVWDGYDEAALLIGDGIFFVQPTHCGSFFEITECRQ